MDTTALHVFHPDLLDPHPLFGRTTEQAARYPEDMAGVATLTPRLAGHLAALSDRPPVPVPCLPYSGAQFGKCYQNVSVLAELFGGNAVTGWVIWHDPGVAYICDHHAVWRSPDGELVCVTPQIPSVPEILFLVQREWAEPLADDTLIPLAVPHYFPAGDDPLLAEVCDLRRAAASYPPGKFEARALHNRAMDLRDRFLARRRRKARKRERRRRGRK